MDEGNMQSKTRFCTNCGSPIFEGQVFCPNCGFKLAQPEMAPPQNDWQQSQNVQPQNNWQQPQDVQPQNNWQQPQEMQPKNEWQQPQTNWQQPQEVQPQVEDVAMDVPQMEDANEPLPEINLEEVISPDEVQPEEAFTQTEDVQPEQSWQQPQMGQTQESWQQPQMGQAQESWQQPQMGQAQNSWQQPQMGQPQAQNQQAYSPYNQPVPPVNAANSVEPKKPMDPKKKKKRIILFSCIGAAFVVLVIVGILLLNYFSYTRLNAEELCKVTYEGVNQKGHIILRLDTDNEAYQEVYKDVIYSDKNIKGAFYLESIEFEADHEDDLYNGDTIRIKTIYDEAGLKDSKVKLTNTEFEVKVDGLPEASEYDLFKDIAIIYEGVNGYGEADIETSGCDSFASSYVRYSFKEDATNLSNGDTITVVATVDEEDLTANGYTTDVFEKEFTIEGLQELQNYDVFKDVKLVYEGTSPNLTVSIDNSACEDVIRDYVYFSIDDGYNKKNGDSITIKADFDVEYLRSKGYEVTTNTKTITIEGQSEKLAAADDELVKQMDTVLNGLLATWMTANGDNYLYETDVVSTMGAGYVLDETKNELVNRYFALKEDGNPYNMYAVINKCTYTVVNKETKDKQEYAIYILAMMSDVAKASDGTYTGTEPETYIYSDDVKKLYEALENTGYTITEVKANK